MKKLSRVSIVTLGLLGLSSCALPPREAWRVIQHDGLVPYIAVEMGHRPVPTYVHLPPVSGSRFVTLTTGGGPKAPRSVVASGVYVKRPPCCVVTNAYLDPSPRPVLAPRPPVAVVAASAPRPETPKPPVVPAKVAAKPRPVTAPVVAVAPVKPKPVPAPVPKPPAAPKPAAKPASSIDSEIANAPKARKAPDAPAPETKPKLPPNPVPAPNPERIVEGKATSTELPFGSAIPGRPGLVNSPFAGKNQLVDVTGLEAGQEVKCPYTGRLFRVPGVQQQAKNNVKTDTEPPPAGKKPQP